MLIHTEEVPAMIPPAIMGLNMPLYQDVLARAYVKKENWDKTMPFTKT